MSYSNTYIAMWILCIGCGYWDIGYWYVRDSDISSYCDVDIGYWYVSYSDTYIAMCILYIGGGYWILVLTCERQ